MAGEFDPDAYLAETPAPEFDPDAYLAEPVNPVKVDSPPRLDPMVDADGIELAALPQTEESKWRADQRAKLAEDQAAEAKRADDGAFLKAGFEQSLKDPDEDGGINKLATYFGIPTSAAATYKADLDIAYRSDQFDPVKFQEENPEITRLLLQNRELAPTIHKDTQVSSLVKFLRKAQDIVEDVTDNPTVQALTTLATAGAYGPGDEAPPVGSPEEAAQYEATKKLRADERASRDAPKRTAFVDDAGARYVREHAPYLAPFGELAQNWESLAIADLQSNIANRILAGQEGQLLGQDVADLKREVLDRKRLNPHRYLGEGGVFADILTGAASTAYVMNPAKTGRGSVDFGLGVLAAVPASFLGSKPGGKYLVGAALATGTFKLEQGSTFDESEAWRTDQGQPLTERERAAAATVYGVGSAAIEMGEFGLLSGLGKSAGALELSGARGVKETFKAGFRALALKDPAFRSMLVKAGAALVGEPAEEGTQALFQSTIAYFAKSLKQGEFQTKSIGQAEVEDALTQAGAVLPFAFAQAAGAAAIGRILGSTNRDDNLTGNGQAEAIAGLKDSATARGAPAAVAGLISDVTAKTGLPTTHLYIDAEVLGTMSLFQAADNTDGKVATVDELLGEGGAKRLEDAIAIGGKVEIPSTLYLQKWAGTPLAEQLAEHTTVRAAHFTAAQLAENPGRIEEQAKLLVEEYDAQVENEKEATAQFAEMEQELVGTGVKKGEAKALTDLWRNHWRTVRAGYGLEAANQVAAQARVSVVRGDAGALGARMLQGGLDALEARAQADDPQQHARDLYIDPLTNARSFDGWNAEERTPGKKVIALTLATIKPINDHAKGGHDTANVILKHISPIARAADPRAARSGTTFLLEGDEATLAATRDAMLKALPEGMAIEGGIGADTPAALAAMEATVDAKRLKGDLPAKRTETKFDLETLPAVEQQLARTQVADPELTPDMLAAAADATPEQKLAAYQDKKNPDVLNEIGFEHSGPRAWVVAFDVRGLKADFNAAFEVDGVKGSGKWAGDLAIAKVAEVAARIGGHSVDFAHLSGDEYAAKHDNKDAVRNFALDLQAELLVDPVVIERNGEVRSIAVQLRFGLGAKTYGAADRALNTAKAGEQTGADSDNARRNEGARARKPGRVAARAERVLQRGTRREAFAGRSEGGPRAAGGDRLALTWFEQDPRSPEDIAAARGVIARMTKVPKREWAGKYLDFIIAGSKGKRPGRGGLSDDVRNEVRLALADAGFIDPEARWNNDQWEFPSTGVKTAKEAAKSHGGGNGGALWKAAHPDDYENLSYAEKQRVDANQDPARGGSKGGSGRMFQEDGPGPVWHSAAARAVETTKQDKNSPAAWLALISKTPGVKAEELEWLGLGDWLKEQKGSVAREQVLEFIKANQIEVTESIRGKAGTAMHENGVTSLELGNEIVAEYKKVKDEAHDAFNSIEITEEELQAPDFEENPKQIERERMTGAFYAAEAAMRDFDAGRVREAAQGGGIWEAAKDDPRWERLSELLSDAALEESLRGTGDDGGRGAFAGDTQFENYKLGGEKPGTYREIVFSAPGTPADQFKSSHFGEGALAHARISEHQTAEGRPLFFVEEIQSDLHQEGREKGYERRGQSMRSKLREEFQRGLVAAGLDEKAVKHASRTETDAEAWAKGLRAAETSTEKGEAADSLPAAKVAATAYLSALAKLVSEERRSVVANRTSDRLPDAPFKTSWEEMVAKRLLRMAAEQGFEQIGWTTGEQQADRYDLSKQIDKLVWVAEPAVEGVSGGSSTGTLQAYRGVSLVISEVTTPDKVSDFIGKEAAKKLLAAPGDGVNKFGFERHQLDGLDLKLGGEGMKSAYDQRIPKIFEKLVKKHGGKVSKTRLRFGTSGELPFHVGEHGDGWAILDNESLAVLKGGFETEEAANAGLETYADQNGPEVWTVQIPESLRKTVVAEGLPLFQFPTPEQSVEAMKQLQVFLDAMREKGAKPIEQAGQVDPETGKPLPVHEQLGQGVLRADGSRRRATEHHDAPRALLARQDAQEANDNAREGIGQREWVGPAVRGASERAAILASPTGVLADVEPSKSLPGQAELEAYLNAVNEDENRLFQEADLVAAVKAALAGDVRPAEKLLAGEASDPKGSVRRIRDGMRDVFQIALNPKSDLSTFIHESGHVFLEVLADLARRDDATDQVKRDWETVQSYLGPALSREQRAALEQETKAPAWSFTREQHEKWARSFEAYAREGKAPSAALRKAFKAFSDWLKEIYKSVSQLGVELNPEIRGVFDRLLATQEEIDAMKRSMGKPLFGSLTQALAAGLTPEKYAEWLDDQEAANSHAERKAKLAINKEELRKKDKQWRADLAAEVTAAEAEYEELPARQASIIILHETRVASLGGFDPGAHSGTRLTLNRAQVEAVVGVAAARRFRLSQDGQDIDVVADTLSGLGFATGADMLKAIEVLPPKDVWAKKLAEHRMAEKNPGLLEDREKLRELVGKGLHGDETERSLLKEIEALTAKAPNGSRPVESIALAAKQMVERTPVGKLNASDALRAERRAANMAVRELAKGNFGEVLTQKHRQLLSMYLYRELQAAREEREKFLELTKDLASDKSRAKLGKANPVLRDGVDYLLEKFGLKGVGQTPTAVDLTAVVRVLEDSDASKVDLPALQEIIAKLGMGDWRGLTMAKLRVVEQTLRNIQGVARYMNTVILDEKRADKADVVEQTLAAIDKEMVKRPAGYGQMASSNTLLEDAGGLYNSITGSLLRPNTMLQDLAGGDVDSIIQRAFIDPLRKAKHVEADLNAEVAAPIIEAFEAIPKSVRATFRDEIDGARLFPDHTDKAQPPRYRYQLLMMALNAGNEGNLQRLLGGAILNPDGSRTVLGRNISPAQLKAALDLLTKEEIAWVQSIFDAHEAPRQLRGETEAKSLKERAFDLEERDTGLRPEAVVAKPLVLKNGALRGGYFPAVYDRSAEPAGERQAAQTLAELFDPTYTRPGTSTGHLKARVPSFIGVISLEPGTIYSHLGKQVHDLAFRDVVKSVGSLVLDQQIDQALKRYLGDGKARQFLKWMKDIGSSNGMLDNSMQGLEKVTQFVRGNMGPAILGWKLTTALGDIGNLGTAVAATPLKTKYLAVGVSTFLTGRSQAVDFAREMSGELRFQKDTLQRDFARNVKDLTSRWRNMKLLGPLAWWKDHSFAFMEMSQLATAVPVWIGSYRQALDEGRAHDEAVRFADNILNQVFPSHSAVDQAGILRDKKFWGLSTMFYGYMNTAYNLQHQIARPLFNREFAEAGAGKRAATVAKVSGSMLALYLSVGALSELFSGRGPEDGDDDDEPSDDPLLRNLARKRNWVVRKTIMAPLTLLPPMGQRGLEAWAVGKRQQGGSGTLVEAYATSIGEGVVGVFKGATDTEKQVVATTRALGLLMGVGTAPIGTTGKYVYDALNGDTEQSPADIASGLAYGQRDKQPENPITFFTGQ